MKRSTLVNYKMYGLGLLVFMLRLSSLTPPDRVLGIDALLSGTLAPLFWLMVLCTFALPLVISTMSVKMKKQSPAIVYGAVCTAGMFLMSMLITQMPLIARGINNRIFF